MMRGARATAVLFGAAATLVVAGARLSAQGARRVEPSAAELAIAMGRLDDAESELYAASTRHPRDPSARGALGIYLASRGRLKVGAVLLQEARQFGGDPAAIDSRLLHVFGWLGDWQSAAALDNGPLLDPAVRAQVRWLAAHPTTRAGPDSSEVPLEPNDLAGLGRIAVRVGETTVTLDVDPTIEGIVLAPDAATMGALQLLGTQGDVSFGAAYRMTIGGYSFANVPVRVEPQGHPRIGLDVLAPLLPTFDPARHRLVLRLATGAAAPSGERLPILLGFPGVRVASREGQPPAALESPAGRAAIRGGPWTFDLRGGVIVVER